MSLYKKLLLLCVMLYGCTSYDRYDADKNLTVKERSEILYSTIRYLGHLPKKGTHDNKFDPVFDEYYSKLALDYQVEAYYKQSDGYEYFLASRVAPSLKVKKVAVGVKMRRDAAGQLTEYEEVFRTWKFEVPEMLEKGFMLFDKMVKGEDLSPYYPQYSGKEEFIEFPDGRTGYDRTERRWKVAHTDEAVEI